MQLNIEKFNPLKAEIISLLENIKNTVISGDKVGYELMKENKKTLQSKRVEFVKTTKDERDGAIKFQKGIIEFEKEVLGLFAEVEDPLTEQIKAREDAEKREKRRELLPERIEKLATIEVMMEENELLDMDEKKFAEYFINAKEKYLNDKQAKIDAENKRIQDEKDAEEREKQRQIELENAKKEAAEQATKEAEEKAEREKQAIIDENNRKERERIAAEDSAKIEEAKRIALEKLEQEKLEKKKKYIKFRADFGWTEETKDDFIEENTGDKVVLFKKVGEFKL